MWDMLHFWGSSNGCGGHYEHTPASLRRRLPVTCVAIEPMLAEPIPKAVQCDIGGWSLDAEPPETRPIIRTL